MMRKATPVLAINFCLILCGCGPSFSPVSGIVKLDGVPVAGANITFVGEDGVKTFAGSTDEGGNFQLLSGAKPGATTGTYKVIVVKIPKLTGADDMKPDDADYMKKMQKDQKDQKATEKSKSASPGSMMGPGGMMRPSAPPKAAGPKSELPAVYASLTTTPITI